MENDFLSILDKLGLKPQDLSTYRTAFTHRSYLNEVKEKIQSNERLEFLGDSVLSLIISAFLFKKRREDTEGDLTNLRAFIVKTDSLAKAAQKLNLGRFLKLSRGEESGGGRENIQLLANTYESFLGAIFLDLGIEAAQKFITSTLLPLFEEEIKQGPPKDPKSELQEILQSKFQISPKYKILQTTGPDHARKFSVGVFLRGGKIGTGFGNNKQQAEEEAAHKALLGLKVTPDMQHC